eukprot:5681793-Ditylum_brightwellii.AAC.1
MKATLAAIPSTMLSMMIAFTLCVGVSAFLTPVPSKRGGVILYDSKFHKDVKENVTKGTSQEKAKKGGGVGETAAGAILGGLVLGPFGALFGASMGANFGSARVLDRAKKEEMERM